MSTKPPQINNEAAFMTALGVDPNQVMAGSIKIEFQQGGQPVISWTTVVGVDMQALGVALLAATQTGQQEETGPKQPQDHKKKAPARKSGKTAAGQKAKEEAGESAD